MSSLFLQYDAPMNVITYKLVSCEYHSTTIIFILDSLKFRLPVHDGHIESNQHNINIMDICILSFFLILSNLNLFNVYMYMHNYICIIYFHE